MATFRLAFDVPFLATNNASKFEKTPTDQRKEEVLTDIGRLFEDVAGGKRSWLSGQTQPSLKLSIDQNATAATGTVTCVTVANNSTVQVGGITFTGKTGTPSGSTQFKCGVSATADALALATAINAHATTSQYVSASSLAGVVTITAIGPALGVIGNGIILSSSDGTNLACVAFASGANDATAQTYTF